MNLIKEMEKEAIKTLLLRYGPIADTLRDMLERIEKGEQLDGRELTFLNELIEEQ